MVETGSFTKAAEHLDMSRASVTQLVQQLEARLRVKLLNRTTRRVQVTAVARPITSACCACWQTWTMPKPACRLQPACHAGACAWTCPAHWRG
ncbi:LysR family transcriptional regulator [Xanthomonas campestris pv. coriandri]|nr:LysR family transcriptional regulator [Xanthomonas campestris pv. coriandri]